MTIMGDTGLEESPLTPLKSPMSPHGGTESGTVDPVLPRLIECWPTLPKPIKTKIKGLIERHAAERKADVERQS